MAYKIEDLQKRLIDLVVDGVGLWGLNKALGYLKPYTIKTLKQYNDPTIKIGISLLDFIVPQITTFPYISDWLQLLGRDGVRDLLDIVIEKKTLCWAEDANTIHCIHFDTTEGLTVKIDGTSVTFTISGTADDFTINLATAMTAGAHDLLVASNKVAFSGKIYV